MHRGSILTRLFECISRQIADDSMKKGGNGNADFSFSAL